MTARSGKEGRDTTEVCYATLSIVEAAHVIFIWLRTLESQVMSSKKIAAEPRTVSNSERKKL